MWLLVRGWPLSLRTGTYQTALTKRFALFVRQNSKTGSQAAPLPGSENRPNRVFSKGGTQLIPPDGVEG